MPVLNCRVLACKELKPQQPLKRSARLIQQNHKKQKASRVKIRILKIALIKVISTTTQLLAMRKEDRKGTPSKSLMPKLKNPINKDSLIRVEINLYTNQQSSTKMLRRR